MQKIDKGFIILTKDGEILATEDRQEFDDYLKKSSNASMAFAFPGMILESLRNLHEVIEGYEAED